MGAVLARRHTIRLKGRDFAWMLPALVLMLLVTGAIAGLISGLPPPDVIGADGMGRPLSVAP